MQYITIQDMSGESVESLIPSGRTGCVCGMGTVFVGKYRWAYFWSVAEVTGWHWVDWQACSARLARGG